MASGTLKADYWKVLTNAQEVTTSGLVVSLANVPWKELLVITDASSNSVSLEVCIPKRHYGRSRSYRSGYYISSTNSAVLIVNSNATNNNLTILLNVNGENAQGYASVYYK